MRDFQGLAYLPPILAYIQIQEEKYTAFKIFISSILQPVRVSALHFLQYFLLELYLSFRPSEIFQVSAECS